MLKTGVRALHRDLRLRSIGIFVVSGLAASVSLMQLPARLVRDLRAAFARAGDVAVVAAVPRWHRLARRVSSRKRATSRRRLRPPLRRSACRGDFATSVGAAAARRPRHSGRRREGRRREVQRLSVSGRAGGRIDGYKPVLEKFERVASRRREVRRQGLAVEHASATSTLAATMHQAACEAAARVRMARDRGKDKEDDGLAVLGAEPAGADAATRCRAEAAEAGSA